MDFPIFYTFTVVITNQKKSSMTTRRRKHSCGRHSTPLYTFSKAALLKTKSVKNNPILNFYYSSCTRHSVLPNPIASIAFCTSTPYLLARQVDFNIQHILPICETLAAFKNEISIKHLSFKDCKLGPMCVPALAACLKENATVTTLDLPGNLITDEVADAMGEIIVTAQTLECLNIDANGMTHKAAAVLAKSVLENGGNTTNLQKIVLTNNYLTQTGVDLLSKASDATGIVVASKTGNFYVEETWSAITHGCGSIWSILMFFLFLRQATNCNASDLTWWAIVIYSISQLTMFLCSTMYHSFSCCVSPSVIYIFGVLDHTAIYLLIAGTYTPYMLILYTKHVNIAIFSMAAIWFLAAVGISLDVMYGGTNSVAKTLGLILYLVQGWYVAFISPWMFPLLTSYSLNLLGLGGLAYTGGVYFFIKGETQVRYHILWHLFVFLGALCHYFSIEDALFGEFGLHNKSQCGLVAK